jgi:hypothetical protein
MKDLQAGASHYVHGWHTHSMTAPFRRKLAESIWTWQECLNDSSADAYIRRRDDDLQEFQSLCVGNHTRFMASLGHAVSLGDGKIIDQLSGLHIASFNHHMYELHSP